MKDNVRELKDKPVTGRKHFKMIHLNKRLTQNVQRILKTTNNLIKNWAKDLNKQLPKYIDSKQAYEKDDPHHMPSKKCKSKQQ